MFWSKPACPCDTTTKNWIERRLKWISRQFPSNIFTDAPLIQPSKEFFPEPYEPSEESAKELLGRVCRWMGVSEHVVALKFHHEPIKVWFVNDNGDYLPHAAGTYERAGRRYVITLDTDELFDIAPLVGTMAHELAHARLLGERRIPPDSFDGELLTDLTASCLGFGIFLANSPRSWVSQFSKWPGTDSNKPEYMTAPMYGYTMAHLAWFQGSRKPSWRKYLGPRVIYAFDEAVKFLFKVGDSSFRPPADRA